MERKDIWYLVHRDILPEAILKTIEAKRLLDTKEAQTINEAVEKAGLSRSAFYKYKDKISPFHEATSRQIITVSLMLEHKKGILSTVLRFVADQGGNILTINQSIPLQGVANVVLSIDTLHLMMNMTDFIEEMRRIAGVKQLIVVGKDDI
ncbi:ACT domain-containing protein [Fervidibacillus halotolerans]|uniref:UPF0735 ACT domain-containing protein OE105_11920 n=1 Tax=Fervidibacillus halotolerans TaxID=2980027 RepID=A0A9E8RXX4_9BACI|nr:ACT domain-containing protein [Fervidibacillus halotolerans]WAA12256.1 ACT domain-containing protein [Fervidibacillus halotolerans]